MRIRWTVAVVGVTMAVGACGEQPSETLFQPSIVETTRSELGFRPALLALALDSIVGDLANERSMPEEFHIPIDEYAERAQRLRGRKGPDGMAAHWLSPAAVSLAMEAASAVGSHVGQMRCVSRAERCTLPAGVIEIVPGPFMGYDGQVVLPLETRTLGAMGFIHTMTYLVWSAEPSQGRTAVIDSITDSGSR